ncbi:hypothetical protein BRYFOR_08752 [Marvinbryantia formatexigens DSM 14469]|uniref:DNA binding domain, excisionase family n=1 Tax=Marvinbryantia formatexigens DSM 14469 TaxID=478749 RepID=C6LJB7_9FIRM|nr:hypothetical protein [Marvinbryantia formatexigens]EET59231.1 hypothetical protein BRYFOR_08752 [Marvinbryantia formatexigens DSM 14469]UWO25435.1 hypothetical protein NQ534_02785 [Marvinbryantia formatexigens DSM 14469]SDG75059.1 hypothetical protein SAMN05660368_03204 [Marvinbryantia formatexigens]
MFDRDEVKDFDLFQLEKLKSELPDAMGCESMVPKLVLQEFQKDSIAEDIMDFLEKPDSLDKEELLEEIQRFINVHLDSEGMVLYRNLLGHNRVYELIKGGFLPALKLGGLKVRKETLCKFLKEYEGFDLTDLTNVKKLDTENIE